MDSKHIMIFGCCGSGKSTLSRQINEKLGIPIVHLDQLFWRSGWNNVSDEEFSQLLDDELQKESWIMDGNYNHTVLKRKSVRNTHTYYSCEINICYIIIKEHQNEKENRCNSWTKY